MNKPTIHVTLEVDVELDGNFGGTLSPEQVGECLSDNLMNVAPYVMSDGERWHVSQVEFSADPISYWYIGPESKVYHTNMLCTALNRADRYWPVQGATEPPKGRTLCTLCARAGIERPDDDTYGQYNADGTPKRALRRVLDEMEDDA